MKATKIEQQSGILTCVGNTPLVRLTRLFCDAPIQLYGKLEMFNPGGSIKDRTAYNILNKAIERGEVNSDTIIVESTSGNMGIGLARICHHLGLRLLLVTDPHINMLTVSLLKVFGAEIVMVDQHDGKGGYLNTRLAKVQELLNEFPNSFWPDQYHNMDNPLAHEQTFLEIVDTLGEAPDYIFISTSTCGTLRGFGDAIQKHNFQSQLVAVDAEGSVIFGDEPRERVIPGMGASRASAFLIPEQVADVVLVSDEDAVDGCYSLLKRESIMAGGSSGAVVKAIERKWKALPKNSIVVAIFADSGERYLHTIYSEEWVNQRFNIQGK